MAVNIDRQYFLILFSEFSKIDSAVVAAYIDIASNRVPASVWGGNVQYATALMTAHMLCSRGHTGSGSAGGAITAEQVGDLSRSYETVAEKGSGDAWLSSTRYGVDFIALRNETIVAMGVTGAPPCGPWSGGWCP